MAGFDYNFKNSSSDFKRRNESRDRKVRLTALFCIVATITAIVIFAIIPSSEAKDKDKTDVNDGDTPEEVVTQSGDSENAVSGEEKKTVNLTETVPPERSGNANPDAEEKLNAALNRGDFKAFFQLADKLISATAPDSEARARLGAILTRGRKKAWQSGKWKADATEYRVVARDYLLRIAKKNHTTLEMLMAGNNLTKKSRISISQKLYLIPGPWQVVISRKAQLLTVLQQGKVFAVFKIAGNNKKPLPAGQFVIRQRAHHPTYIDPQGRHFKYGSDENMLGEAMLYLRDKNGKGRRRFGFHGVSAQKKMVRDYCIQMYNDDILMLYHLLPTSTPVEVTD